MPRNKAHLHENSKTAKTVAGEIGSVSYTTMTGSGNHVSAKRLRTVDGTKGLGKEPKKLKKVQSPKVAKSRERRRMAEETMASMRSDTCKNRDESMPAPKVTRGKYAPKSSKRKNTKIGSNKNNPATAGRPRVTKAAYVGGEKVKVATVQEGLNGLVDFLGCDITIRSDMLENSSGGAVGAGAMASSPSTGRRSELFASDDEPVGFGGDNLPSRVFVQYRMRISDLRSSGANDDMWNSMARLLNRDDRLSEDERKKLLDKIETYTNVVRDGNVYNPTDIAHIPQDPEQYIADLNVYLERTYYLSWAELDGDTTLINHAISKGMTPVEFADKYAAAHNMEKM